MTNQRARSVKSKFEPIYIYVKSPELRKLGFAFTKATLYSSLAEFLEGGLDYPLTLEIADKGFSITQFFLVLLYENICQNYI